jgi:hypothetical protein
MQSAFLQKPTMCELSQTPLCANALSGGHQLQKFASFKQEVQFAAPLVIHRDASIVREWSSATSTMSRQNDALYILYVVSWLRCVRFRS